MTNKIDLAPHAGTFLEVMERDSKRLHGAKQSVLNNLKDQTGLADIAGFIAHQGLL